MNESRKKFLLFHLPKTGGVTVAWAFRKWLGKEKVTTLQRSKLPEALADLDPSFEAINGHFNYCDLGIHLELNEWIQVVWLREPVKRVVSNFHYFKKTLRQPKPHAVEMARINAHRLEEPLMTYARYNENRNLMSGRLAGASPEDFDFIGQVEHIEEDLARLAAMLGFDPLRVVKKKNAGTYEPALPEELAEIRELNSEDIAWHQEWKAVADARAGR